MEIKSNKEIDELKRIVNSFRRMGQPSFVTEREKQFFLICVFRVLDFHYLSSKSITGDFHNFIDHGTNDAIEALYSNIEGLKGFPLATFDLNSFDKAWKYLHIMGEARIVEQYLDAAYLDVTKIISLKTKEIEFVLERVFTSEFIERVEWERFLSNKNAGILKELNKTILEETENIEGKLFDLVQPWRDHFIQYSTTPEIDDHFWTLAEIDTFRFSEKDDFPPDAKFGGVEYRLYLLAVKRCIGFALKHIVCCKVLRKKDESIKNENITTYFTNVEVFKEELSAVTGLSGIKLDRVYQSICLGPWNNESFKVGSPSVTLVSDGILIRSMWGALSNPYAFMLENLRSTYRKDWDYAVDRREEIFRFELIDLISKIPNLLPCSRSIEITKNKKILTDIDAAFVDLQTSNIVLIQLKWQDPFGRSIRKRESRKKNFVNTGNKWIEDVTAWVHDHESDVAKALHLDELKVSRINKVSLLVIGRYFSEFSGHDERDKRAVWCNWAQLNSVINSSFLQISSADDTIEELLLKIKNYKINLGEQYLAVSKEIKCTDYLFRVPIVVRPSGEY